MNWYNVVKDEAMHILQPKLNPPVYESESLNQTIYVNSSSKSTEKDSSVWMYMYVYFQGKQFCHFSFCLPFQWKSTLEEKKSLLWEKLLIHCRRLCHLERVTESHKISFSL